MIDEDSRRTRREIRRVAVDGTRRTAAAGRGSLAARSTVLAAAVAMVAVTATGCLPGNASSVTSSATASAGAAGSAAQELAGLRIAPSTSMAGYSREQFGHGWAQQPGSACDSREIVLQRQGRDVKTDPKTCKVVSGTWTSLYDGVTVTDASALDIDHLVPEAVGWRSGAASWSQAQREKFANDWASGELVAVTAHSNRSKGDSEPPDYMPPNQGQWCAYATGWISVKTTYQLTVTQREHDGLARMLTTCR